MKDPIRYNMKRCCTCGVKKPAIDFYKNKSQSSGLQNKCKECQKEYEKNNKHIFRRSWDKTHYNLTKEQSDVVEDLRVNGKCFCCGRKANGRKLYLDHDHLTGEIRGILCSECNTFEGLLKKQVSKNNIEPSGWWQNYLLNPPGVFK